MPSESIQVTDVQDYFLNGKSLRVQNVTADTERVLCIKATKAAKSRCEAAAQITRHTSSYLCSSAGQLRPSVLRSAPTFCLDPQFSSESAHNPSSCCVRCWMFQLCFPPWQYGVATTTNTHSFSTLERLISESETVRLGQLQSGVLLTASLTMCVVTYS